jgi:hypothetical protein
VVGQKLRPVIQSNRLRLTAPSHHLLQHTDHPFGGGQRIHLNGQDFPHAFIKNVECPESSPVIQRITHKVDGPQRVRLRDDNERLSETDRQSLMVRRGKFSRNWQ